MHKHLKRSLGLAICLAALTSTAWAGPAKNCNGAAKDAKNAKNSKDCDKGKEKAKAVLGGKDPDREEKNKKLGELLHRETKRAGEQKTWKW